MEFEFLLDYINKWLNTDLWYKRNLYLKPILTTLNDNIVKIISWIRRVWKSYILRQIIAELLDRKVRLNNILYIHLEDERLVGFSVNDLRDIFEFWKNSFVDDVKFYVFLDEIQNVKNWQKFVRNLQETYWDKIQIFITWSNSNLLSSEFATILTWRYVEFTIYPFSFKEFLEFKNISISALNPKKYELFEEYLKFWGLPEVIKIENKETKENYVKSLVDSIIFKDIVQRYNIKKSDFLENLIKYIYLTICSNLSINAILNYLKQEYKTLDYETLNNYVDYAKKTFLITHLQSIWEKTRHILKWKNKFYGIDTWIRGIFSNNFDIEKQIENFVYLELKRRWYELNFLEWANFEIDFIAEKKDEKKYIQVSYTINKNEETFSREIKPFFLTKWQYEKILLTLDDENRDYDGVKIENLIDWCLK